MSVFRLPFPKELYFPEVKNTWIIPNDLLEKYLQNTYEHVEKFFTFSNLWLSPI